MNRYILLNTAISKTWGFPTPCPLGCSCSCFDCRKQECACGLPPAMCQNFPASFLIDHVRVFQKPDDRRHTLSCSPEAHPTKTYIEVLRCLLYSGNNIVVRVISNATWSMEILCPSNQSGVVFVYSLTWSITYLCSHGGGHCEVDADCGFGKCKTVRSLYSFIFHGKLRVGECACESAKYTGPTCLVRVFYACFSAILNLWFRHMLVLMTMGKTNIYYGLWERFSFCQHLSFGSW